MSKLFDHFGARAKLPGTEHHYYRLNKLGDVSRLPFSIKVLLEALLRTCDGYEVMPEDVEKLAKWNAASPAKDELPFKPGRVILQDFTGVPAVVDLAAAIFAAILTLVWNLQKYVIIALTAIGGANALLLSVLLLIGKVSLESLRTAGTSIKPILQDSWFWLIVWLVVAIVGIVVQIRLNRDYTFTADRYIEGWG